MNKQEREIIEDAIMSAQSRGEATTKKMIKELKMSFPDIKISPKDLEKMMGGSNESNDIAISSSILDVMKSIQDDQRKEREQEQSNKEILQSFSEKLTKEMSDNYDAMGFYLSADAAKDGSDLKFRQGVADSILQSSEFKDLGMVRDDVMGIVDKKMDKFIAKNGSLQRKYTHSMTRFFESKAGEHLKAGVMDAMGTMAGHMNNVLGETKTLLIDPIMNIGKTAFDMVMDTDMDEGDVETHSLLDSIFNKLDEMQSLDEKMFDMKRDDYLEGELIGTNTPKKSKGVFGDLFSDLTPIALLITGLGLTLGSLVKSIIIPFELLAKVTGLLKPFTTILTKASDFLGPMIQTMSTKIPLMGKFFKAFAAGFKILGWPLTILLGAIDFFKGFIGSSEKTFMGKLTDGLKSAVVGLFDLPIMVIGWVVDTMLGWVGLDFEKGAGSAMKDMLGVLLDVVLSPFKSLSVIFDGIGDVIGNVIDIGKGIISFFGNLISGMWNLLTGDFDGAIKNLSGMGSSIKSIFSNLFDGLMSFMTTLPKYFIEVIKNNVSSVFTSIGDFLGIDGLGAIITDVWDNFVGSVMSLPFGDIARDAWDAITTPFGMFIDTIVGIPQQVNEYLLNKLPWWLGGKTKEERDKESQLSSKRDNAIKGSEINKDIAGEFSDKVTDIFKRKGIRGDDGYVSVYGSDAREASDNSNASQLYMGISDDEKIASMGYQKEIDKLNKRSIFMGIFDNIKGLGSKILSGVAESSSMYMGFLTEAYGKLFNGVLAPFNYILGIMEGDGLIQIIDNIWSDIKDSWSGFFDTLFDLPTKLKDMLPSWLGGSTEEEKSQRRSKEKSASEPNKYDKDVIAAREIYEDAKKSLENDKKWLEETPKGHKDYELAVNQYLGSVRNEKVLRKDLATTIEFAKIMNTPEEPGKPEKPQKKDIPWIPFLQDGALTSGEGIAYLHPNEITGPVETVIPQLVKEVMSNTIMMQKNVIKQSPINNPSSEKSINTTVISNGGGNKTIPSDIESLSLLFLNSSWGLS